MNKFRRWINRQLYIPKHAKIPDKTFSRVMLTSAFGIVLCAVCLVGMTLAWFTGSATSTANNITAADFSVITTFKVNGETVNPPAENGSYTLDSAVYSVTVEASGTASTGYCRIETDGGIYHTVQLYPAAGEGRPQSVTFTVNAAGTSKLTVTPQWGTYAKPEDETLIGSSKGDINIISAQSMLLSESNPSDTQTYNLTDSEQIYTVQKGDTLSKIANRYGTTADVLAAYNGISDSDAIQAGETVKIPPAGYTVPAADNSELTAVTTGSAAGQSSPEDPSEHPSDTSVDASEDAATEPVS